ncbi:cobalt-zinc-cadmium efflux system membrane fusion protein [Arcicella aurantiaca]|uniref:Cobalt-zinc-cadmium efflux system membrane fusion protein n=1 Tax=Arcicella aurantiaca TaxID=591202 RepID=A0A316DHD7_9BACT|nr:efflux RND transporter periplasmic adaptor subunit [Arcicella aurantiaca]PWK17086.1 cobalt-zinc-cadmium efflux system membrane fusion protein [Arcicella aurantiaca]
MKFNHHIIKYSAVLFVIISILSCQKSTETTTIEEHHQDEKGTVELTQAQVKASQIILGNFERKNLSEVVTANGYTKLPPQNQADVSVFMAGIIKSIAVIEGQYVKKGQNLATFQSIEYNNLRLQKAKLTEEIQQAKVTKEYLSIDFNRQKELSEENITAKKIFQKISADFEAIKSKIENLEHQIKILEQTISLSGKENSTSIAILAPISGYITAVNVKIGSSVAPNTSLFSIVDNSKMHVDLLVYEKDLFKIKVGQNVRFVLTNRGNQEIMGNIFSIGQAFQNETKSVAVHADINNHKAGLISGMYVSALIDIGKNDVNTLPIDAVVKAEGTTFIFIQDVEATKGKEEKESNEQKEGVHFKRIEVKTGTAQLGFIQVSPLQEIPSGAKIVLKGSYYLQSSIANAEGGDEH